MEEVIINNKKEDLRLFLGYIVCAGIATVVDFLFLYALTEFFGLHYLISAAIAYVFGMTTNYTLNKIYNFKNKSSEVKKQFLLFIFVALIGLGLNQIILYILVERFGLWYIFAKAVGVLIVMIWSFYGHKKITFNLLQ